MSVHEQRILAFEAFSEAVLRPAIYSDPQPLAARAHVTRRAISASEAKRRAYREVKPGWTIGPAGATCWFQLSSQLPESLHGAQVALRFSCGAEALVWEGNQLLGGLDRERPVVQVYGRGLSEPEAGEHVEFWVEVLCAESSGSRAAPERNLVPGDGSASQEVGVFERAELCRFHPDVLELDSAFTFVCELARELQPNSPRRVGLESALQRSQELIRGNEVVADAATAIEPLRAVLSIPASGASPIVHAVASLRGSSQPSAIDDVRRSCLHRFSNALSMAGRDEDSRFVAGPASHWSLVEESTPELFERMKEGVARGRLEAEGGLWVEPEVNVTSGESLVRQILYARRYWEEHLGADGFSRCLYLPDLDAFPASLPQVMTQAGLELLITNTPSAETGEFFPHTSFLWKGADGSEVLTHLAPATGNAPNQLVQGASDFRPIAHLTPGRLLQAFGNAGGGPTRRELHRVFLSKDCDGLPRVRLDTQRGFLEALREDRELCLRRGTDFPRWVGGLELNSQGWTTHRELNARNRQSEAELVYAELLHYASPVKPDAPAALRERLDRAWKRLLLEQRFVRSSVLSSAVEDEAAANEEAIAELRSLVTEGAAAWANCVDTEGLTDPLIVLNPAGGAPRHGVIDAPDSMHGGAPLWVDEVPAFGVVAVDASRAAERSMPAPARASGTRLENEYLEVEIDAVGRVSRLLHKPSGRECGALTPGAVTVPPQRQPLNQLLLFDDHSPPGRAPGSGPKGRPVSSHAESLRVLENGPLRAKIEVSRSIGRASHIVQTYCLTAGSPRLDVETVIDWCEENASLRAHFPVDVVSASCTLDIPFGVSVRQVQAFGNEGPRELCAHRFADLSEHGFGVALLNDSRYGHSFSDGVLGLTLARSGSGLASGEHRLKYALMPHAGDWRASGVLDEAQRLNHPLRIMRASRTSPRGTRAERSWAPFEIEVPEGSSSLPTVDAFKAAEEGDAVCLRLHEHGGGRGEVIVHWRLDVDHVETVDLVENARPRDGFIHIGHKTRLSLSPFEILTLRVSLRR